MPGKQHLFIAAHWLLKAATALAFGFIAILVLSLGAILVAATNLDGNHLGIPANLEGIARGDALSVGAFGISGVLVCAVLALFAFRATTAIVETAASGDPFVNENAKRLNRVGSLLLAFVVVQFLTHQVVKSIVARLAAEHQLAVSDVGRVSFGSDVSPVALLAVLLIFVLAQIFRRGSEMRAELDGTV